jgi:hypothetical protein
MSKIINFGGETLKNLPVKAIMEGGIDNIPESAVVVGFDHDGELYVASTDSDIAVSTYLLSKALHFMMEQ